MKQSIANITLLVDDYDKAIEFYTKKNGFWFSRRYRFGQRQTMGESNAKKEGMGAVYYWQRR